MIFTPPPAITMEEATTLAVELFGVTEEHASRETRQQKGGYYSQQWLFEVYRGKIITGNMIVSRVYFFCG
jgi:hypothetical protein